MPKSKKATKQATKKPKAAKIARATAERPIKPEKPKTSAETPTATPDAPPTPTDETVVFAIRLRRSERDLIHKAAGSGKASQFVRSLAVAAAERDLKALQEIVKTGSE